MAIPMLEAASLDKTFDIPDVRRNTVREHATSLFRRRHFHPLKAVDNVSFAVDEGSTFGIMGRNGCGKSTLLKIISGIYRADRGSVVSRGGITPILELGVGWNPELDAIDNILLVGTLMGASLRQLRTSTPEILAFAELEEFANLKLQHYSSGMASRLAYAVAFTAVRDVLIIDEVFAVGDAGFRARCEARYRELRRAGKTVILVSHDPRIITTFCDRAMLMDGGRSLMVGAPQQIADAYLSMLQPPVAGARPL
jgi:ABC-type polysaccharide/polyol phosphate transport system ATPase subunit